MTEQEARIAELEAEVKKLNDEVFYWRKAFDRALVAYTNIERKLDGKPELF
jgi:cell division protein FtsB